MEKIGFPLLSPQELTRYSRQIRLEEIGIEGQQKIRAASVLVIGAGALGCPVLQYLSAAGVGTIGILDNDWVDETNLHRQVIYSQNDIGKPKPLVAWERLKELNPDVTFKMHFLRFDKTCALKVISGYDIIVDCTDNFSTRYIINDTCVIKNKPWVYGAVNKFEGQISVFNYNGGPTLRCIYPDIPHPFEVPSCSDLGVVGAVTGIIGSMQALEVIKIIIGSDDVLSGKLMMLNTSGYQFYITSFRRDPVRSDITELKEYEEDRFFDKEPVTEITRDQLRIMLDENPDIPLIDLRDPEDNDHIGFTSIPIPHYDIDSGKEVFLQSKAAVFYCRSGSRSANVIRYLRQKYKLEKLYSLII
jgi:adenylyltransferase/sulfurtransferase